MGSNVNGEASIRSLTIAKLLKTCKKPQQNQIHLVMSWNKTFALLSKCTIFSNKSDKNKGSLMKTLLYIQQIVTALSQKHQIKQT